MLFVIYCCFLCLLYNCEGAFHRFNVQHVSTASQFWLFETGSLRFRRFGLCWSCSRPGKDLINYLVCPKSHAHIIDVIITVYSIIMYIYIYNNIYIYVMYIYILYVCVVWTLKYTVHINAMQCMDVCMSVCVCLCVWYSCSYSLWHTNSPLMYTCSQEASKNSGVTLQFFAQTGHWWPCLF